MALAAGVSSIEKVLVHERKSRNLRSDPLRLRMERIKLADADMRHLLEIGMAKVYDGKEIVAHFVQGHSSYLLVSFIGAYHEIEADDTFLLKELVKKYSISCVGITTRIRSFYLSDEMNAVCDFVAGIRSGYEQIIVVGQSMGAYAALKFSKALNASCVLAFSPYYSINANELALETELERKILKRSIGLHSIEPWVSELAMAVSSADCTGFITVVFDPDDFVDSHAAKLIGKAVPDAHVVPLHHSGHMSFEQLEKDGKILQIVTTVLSQDARLVRKQIHRIFKYRADYVIQVVTKSARIKPILSARALRSTRIENRIEREKLRMHPVNNMVVGALFQRGDFIRAIDHLNYIYNGMFSDTILQSDTPPTEGVSYLLLSHLGLYLGFDEEAGKPKFFSNVFAGDKRIPVFVSLQGGKLDFHYFSRASLEQNRLIDDILRQVSLQPDKRVGDNCFCFPIDGNYLRTFPDGCFDREIEAVDEWERYVLIPMRDKEACLKLMHVDWLDRMILAQSATSEIAAEKASKPRLWFGPKWRQLFSKP